MSTKGQALVAAFTSTAVVSTLPFNGFISLHIASIQGYGVSFKLISDRAWRAVKLSGYSTVGVSLRVQLLDCSPVVQRKVFTLLVWFSVRI